MLIRPAAVETTSTTQKTRVLTIRVSRSTPKEPHPHARPPGSPGMAVTTRTLVLGRPSWSLRQIASVTLASRTVTRE